MNNPKPTTTKSNPTSLIMPVAVSQFESKEINKSSLVQMIISLQSNQRSANAHVKTRGMVAGTTKKPWRQKGTGRARVGTRRNPVWRGGGVVFGPSKERNFSRKINQKNKFPALMWILSQKANAGEILEIKQMPKFNKTKEIFTFLKNALNIKNNLLVLPEKDENLLKLIKNIKNIKVVLASNLNFLDVVKYHHVIFLPKALAIVTGKITNIKDESR